MPEWAAGIYLAISLAVFVWGVATIRVPYGRGTTDKIDWGSAFVFALVWPILFVLIAYVLLTEGRN